MELKCKNQTSVASIDSINDLLDLLKQIRNTQGYWTAKFVLFADGSGHIEDDNDKVICSFHSIKSVKVTSKSKIHTCIISDVERNAEIE